MELNFETRNDVHELIHGYGHVGSKTTLLMLDGLERNVLLNGRYKVSGLEVNIIDVVEEPDILNYSRKYGLATDDELIIIPLDRDIDTRAVMSQLRYRFPSFYRYAPTVYDRLSILRPNQGLQRLRSLSKLFLSLDEFRFPAFFRRNIANDVAVDLQRYTLDTKRLFINIVSAGGGFGSGVYPYLYTITMAELESVDTPFETMLFVNFPYDPRYRIPPNDAPIIAVGGQETAESAASQAAMLLETLYTSDQALEDREYEPYSDSFLRELSLTLYGNERRLTLRTPKYIFASFIKSVPGINRRAKYAFHDTTTALLLKIMHFQGEKSLGTLILEDNSIFNNRLVNITEIMSQLGLPRIMTRGLITYGGKGGIINKITLQKQITELDTIINKLTDISDTIKIIEESIKDLSSRKQEYVDLINKSVELLTEIQQHLGVKAAVREEVRELVAQVDNAIKNVRSNISIIMNILNTINDQLLNLISSTSIREQNINENAIRQLIAELSENNDNLKNKAHKLYINANKIAGYVSQIKTELDNIASNDVITLINNNLLKQSLFVSLSRAVYMLNQLQALVTLLEGLVGSLEIEDLNRISMQHEGEAEAPEQARYPTAFILTRLRIAYSNISKLERCSILWFRNRLCRVTSDLHEIIVKYQSAIDNIINTRNMLQRNINSLKSSINSVIKNIREYIGDLRVKVADIDRKVLEMKRQLEELRGERDRLVSEQERIMGEITSRTLQSLVATNILSIGELKSIINGFVEHMRKMPLEERSKRLQMITSISGLINILAEFDAEKAAEIKGRLIQELMNVKVFADENTEGLVNALTEWAYRQVRSGKLGTFAGVETAEILAAEAAGDGDRIAEIKSRIRRFLINNLRPAELYLIGYTKDNEELAMEIENRLRSAGAEHIQGVPIDVESDSIIAVFRFLVPLTLYHIGEVVEMLDYYFGETTRRVYDDGQVKSVKEPRGFIYHNIERNRDGRAFWSMIEELREFHSFYKEVTSGF